MAKNLAKEIGYIYVDSGAMYRAVTLFALRNNIFTADRIDENRLQSLLPNIIISFGLDSVTGLPYTCLNGENVES